MPGEVVRDERGHTLVPGTALPGGRPSTSRPEFLSDDDSVLTRFEDEAQVFGYLTGRLNDSANRDPLTRRSPRGVRTIFQARFCHPVGNSEPPLTSARGAPGHDEVHADCAVRDVPGGHAVPGRRAGDRDAAGAARPSGGVSRNARRAAAKCT